jgi:hypothetical protein
MTVFKWSATAANNDDIDSTINWAEGQAPSTVNDSARAMMAAIAKLYADIGGNILTAGSSTAFTVTSNQGFTTLQDGIFVTARIHVASGAAPTLNVDSLGAKQIRSVLGTNIPTGALALGGVHKFTYDSTDDAWIVNDRFADSFNATNSPDLAAIEALATTGVVRRSGANTWATDAGVAHLAATTANRLFGTDGAGASGLVTLSAPLSLASSALSVAVATQAEMEAASSTTIVVAPGRQHFHPSAAKLWGGVDYSAGTPSIGASHNITSLTDTGTGSLSVTIATDFSSTDYGLVVNGERAVANVCVFDSDSRSAGSFSCIVNNSSTGAAVDPVYVSFSAFGDQA